MRQIYILLILLTGNLLRAQKPRLVVPIGHTSAVTSVAFSPDGKTVLTGSWDNTAKLWDLAGRELQSFNGHTSLVSSVAFSPDGKAVLTGSYDNTAKLWDLSGRELQSFNGHASYVLSVAFSPDGKSVLTGSKDHTAKLWDLSGRELEAFTIHTSDVNSVAFSPDGKAILTGSSDKTVKLWGLSGSELFQFFGGHFFNVNSVAFSPDGMTVLTGSKDNTARLWDLSGSELRLFSGHGDAINSVAFSPDGKAILTGSLDGTAKLWDLSGKVLQSFNEYTSAVTSVAFSPDGKAVLTGHEDNTAKLWDLSGRQLQAFKGHSSTVLSVAFSPDGKTFLTGNYDHKAKLWGLPGRQLQSFNKHADAVFSVAYSPDGKTVLTGSWDDTAKLWDLTGRELRTFSVFANAVYSVAFSPDGKTVLTGGHDNKARLWDLSGRQLQSFNGHVSTVSSVAFSPDGKTILTGSKDYTAKLWDLSGGELQSFNGHVDNVFSVAFSPDGKTILTGSKDKTAKLWDLSGRELQSFIGHASSVSSVAFSPDGKTALTGSWDKTAKLWDLSGWEMQSFKGHASAIFSVAFSPDKKTVLTGSDDNTTKIWDANTGKLLATLIAIDSNDWVVTTPSGLFDASPGAMNLMHYMVGLEVIALEQLKTRYYEPYLLSKVMGFSPGGLRPVDELDNVPLYPEILEAGIKNDLLNVRLKTRSGGIGKVALELDGFELIADVNPARKASFELNLKPYLDFFSPVKPNHLSLKLYNQTGWLESQPYVLEHGYDGVSARDPNNPDKPRRSLNDLTDAALEKVHFYALVVGTSKYRDSTLNLKYPEKDATIFADALRKAGGKLFKDRVEVHLLSTESEPWPRKAAIRKALGDIAAKAGPDDILLVYFSGHGITYPPVSEAGQFYYLTTDIAGDNLKDEAILKTQAIAQDSLMDWVRQIKARKRILIYDACNSGSVVAQFEHGAKDLNTDQRRALERMKDRTGMFVLAGSAANKSSFEASNYGHGLLTYSLINGMLKVAANNQGAVELGDLFAFVEDDVERLAKNINREQRPEVIKAESYPIGIIDKDTDIKMPVELPVFVRVSMMAEKKNKDLLGLSKVVNAELERLSATRAPALVFWDVESYEGKYYYIGGQYQSDGVKITGNVSLYLQDTELTNFPISGSVDALGKLAKDLVFEVQAYLKQNPSK